MELDFYISSYQPTHTTKKSLFCINRIKNRSGNDVRVIILWIRLSPLSIFTATNHNSTFMFATRICWWRHADRVCMSSAARVSPNFLFIVGNFLEFGNFWEMKKEISCGTWMLSLLDEFRSVQIMQTNDEKRGLTLFNKSDRQFWPCLSVHRIKQN